MSGDILRWSVPGRSHHQHEGVGGCWTCGRAEAHRPRGSEQGTSQRRGGLGCGGGGTMDTQEVTARTQMLCQRCCKATRGLVAEGHGPVSPFTSLALALVYRGTGQKHGEWQLLPRSGRERVAASAGSGSSLPPPRNTHSLEVTFHPLAVELWLVEIPPPTPGRVGTSESLFPLWNRGLQASVTTPLLLERCFRLNVAGFFLSKFFLR